MPAPPDVVRILADAHVPSLDPDARAARARVDRRGLRLRRPRWLRAPRAGVTGGGTLPVLRDYPWRSSDGA
jgi:hypothetical protein